MKTMRYDLLVIGSGPFGQQGAIAAARLNKRVAIVEREDRSAGGVCLSAGSIPSKTLREATLHLSGDRQRDVCGDLCRKKRKITMEDIRHTFAEATRRERDIVHDQLERNGVDNLVGEARFVGPHEVEVVGRDGTSLVQAEHILIACGTKPSRPAHIPFDGTHIVDTDELIGLDRIPRSMIVVGGGVIGIEYALMFAALGVRVTVVDRREQPVDSCDREIVDSLLDHAQSSGMALRLGEEVIGIDCLLHDNVAVELESGERLLAETVLFTAGRIGDTDHLNLQAAGLEPDDRGRLWCNEDHQTWVPHIYAVGDVVGFPARAGIAKEQGRRAVCHAFGEPFKRCQQMPDSLLAATREPASDPPDQKDVVEEDIAQFVAV